jgi:hypothetical protein
MCQGSQLGPQLARFSEAGALSYPGSQVPLPCQESKSSRVQYRINSRQNLSIQGYFFLVSTGLDYVTYSEARFWTSRKLYSWGQFRFTKSFYRLRCELSNIRLISREDMVPASWCGSCFYCKPYALTITPWVVVTWILMAQLRFPVFLGF